MEDDNFNKDTPDWVLDAEHFAKTLGKKEPCEPNEHHFGGFLEPKNETHCIHCGIHRDEANADLREKYLSKNKQ